jgi:hypothetical protein
MEGTESTRAVVTLSNTCPSFRAPSSAFTSRTYLGSMPIVGARRATTAHSFACARQHVRGGGVAGQGVFDAGFGERDPDRRRRLVALQRMCGQSTQLGHVCRGDTVDFADPGVLGGQPVLFSGRTSVRPRSFTIGSAPSRWSL